MNKKDTTPEAIQKRYTEIMKQSSMQIFLIPILVISLIAGAISNSQTIYMTCMAPIVFYMLWFRLVIYKCPKCGHLFDKNQVYTYECKHCQTKFTKK